MFARAFLLMTAAVCAGGLLAPVAASAAEIKPAVVYDLGGKFDKSFNEGVFNGATKFTKETGIKFRDLEIQNEAQREQVLRKFAKDGYSPIMTVGFPWETALKKVAPEYPKTDFGIIDDVVDLPNVQSIVFKEHEGSFVVGVIAADTSKTGKVGFVGGMDIPLIRKFGCGYAQGVEYASGGKDEVFANMTGTTPAAWNDPVKGGELAKSQMDRGADIVYAAAGGTGQGVFKAAADAGKFGIGVDSTRTLFPGHVLTSMLKHVDVATYKSFMDAKNGVWKPGVQVLGLKEGGVDYAVDENNKTILTKEVRAKADQAKADIISGKIQVHDYMSDNKCPA